MVLTRFSPEFVKKRSNDPRQPIFWAIRGFGTATSRVTKARGFSPEFKQQIREKQDSLLKTGGDKFSRFIRTQQKQVRLEDSRLAKVQGRVSRRDVTPTIVSGGRRIVFGKDRITISERNQAPNVSSIGQIAQRFNLDKNKLNKAIEFHAQFAPRPQAIKLATAEQLKLSTKPPSIKEIKVAPITTQIQQTTLKELNITPIKGVKLSFALTGAGKIGRGIKGERLQETPFGLTVRKKDGTVRALTKKEKAEVLSSGVINLNPLNIVTGFFGATRDISDFIKSPVSSSKKIASSVSTSPGGAIEGLIKNAITNPFGFAGETLAFGGAGKIAKIGITAPIKQLKKVNVNQLKVIKKKITTLEKKGVNVRQKTPDGKDLRLLQDEVKIITSDLVDLNKVINVTKSKPKTRPQIESATVIVKTAQKSFRSRTPKRVKIIDNRTALKELFKKTKKIIPQKFPKEIIKKKDFALNELKLFQSKIKSLKDRIAKEQKSKIATMSENKLISLKSDLRFFKNSESILKSKLSQIKPELIIGGKLALPVIKNKLFQLEKFLRESRKIKDIHVSFSKLKNKLARANISWKINSLKDVKNNKSLLSVFERLKKIDNLSEAQLGSLKNSIDKLNKRSFGPGKTGKKLSDIEVKNLNNKIKKFTTDFNKTFKKEILQGTKKTTTDLRKELISKVFSKNVKNTKLFINRIKKIDKQISKNDFFVKELTNTLKFLDKVDRLKAFKESGKLINKNNALKNYRMKSLKLLKDIPKRERATFDVKITKQKGLNRKEKILDIEITRMKTKTELQTQTRASKLAKIKKTEEFLIKEPIKIDKKITETGSKLTLKKKVGSYEIEIFFDNFGGGLRTQSLPFAKSIPTSRSGFKITRLKGQKQITKKPAIKQFNNNLVKDLQKTNILKKKIWNKTNKLDLKIKNKKISKQINKQSIKLKKRLKTLEKLESKIMIKIATLIIANSIKQKTKLKQKEIIKLQTQLKQKLKEIIQDQRKLEMPIDKGIIFPIKPEIVVLRKPPVKPPKKPTVRTPSRPPVRPPKKPPVRPPKKPKPKLPKLPRLNLDTKLPKGVRLAFNIKFKERGKIKTMQAKLPLNKALSRLGDAIDKTTQRSAELVIAGLTKQKDSTLPKVISKFRLKRSKNKKVLKLVEKTKHAIDTGGEKRGLLLSRLLAPKKKKKKTTKKKK